MPALALVALLFVPVAATPTARPTPTVADLVAERRADWTAQDAAPLVDDRDAAGPAGARPADAATPVVTSVPPGVPGGPAHPRGESPRQGEPAATEDESGAQAETELQQAAREATLEVARARLAQADAVAARAAAPETKRIPLADFQLLLQRASCAAAHGPLDRGLGAACMARPSDAGEGAQEDNEEARLCAAQGGVLVARMARCTAASATLAGMNAEEGASVGLEVLVGAFAEVARQCWGQTLCVE